jgi:hypothetical protein
VFNGLCYFCLVKTSTWTWHCKYWHCVSRVLLSQQGLVAASFRIPCNIRNSCNLYIVWSPYNPRTSGINCVMQINVPSVRIDWSLGNYLFGLWLHFNPPAVLRRSAVRRSWQIAVTGRSRAMDWLVGLYCAVARAKINWLPLQNLIQVYNLNHSLDLNLSV